jgi:hypothetical protein
LERKRDDYWAEVKERRDTTGEVSEGESWCTGSTSDHENENEEVVHVEDVAEETPTSADKPESTPTEAAETAESVEDEKPSTFAEAVKTTSDNTSEPKVDEPKESQVDEKKEPEVQGKENKEEGYELL